MDAVNLLVVLLAAALSAVLQAWVIQEVVRQADVDWDRNTQGRSLAVSAGIIVADAMAASGSVAISSLGPSVVSAPLQLVGAFQALLIPLIVLKLAYRLRWRVALGSAFLLLFGRAVTYGAAGIALGVCLWIHPAVAFIGVSLVLAVTFLRWQTARSLARIADDA